MAKKKIRAAVIVNTKSRKGRRLFFDALELIQKAGIEIGASYPILSGQHLQKAVKESIDQGFKLIIIGGGDGTLSSVMKHFAYRDIVLGILPLGTGNSLARSLDLPLTLPEVVEVIAKGKVAKVNLGKVGTEYFGNVASIGVNARIARETPDVSKKYLGYLAYAATAIKFFLRGTDFYCHMKINKDTVDARLTQVVIANGSVFGITKIYPEAHIDNNELVVATIASGSLIPTLKAWTAFMLGKPKLFAGVKLHSARTVTIKTTPIHTVYIDGEPSLTTPIRAEVAREALRVMVPKDFVDKK